MPDLMLNDVEQQALRDLLAAEPCPGSPLPSRGVLARLGALLPADEIMVAYVGGPRRALEGIPPGSGRDGPGQRLSVGFGNGPDGVVQLTLLREGGPFTERDLAVLRLVTPLLARLVRERPRPSPTAPLTAQERHVLARVAAGQSNAQIAEELFIAASTVRKHLEHAYRKLGVHSRMAAVVAVEGRPLHPAESAASVQRFA